MSRSTYMARGIASHVDEMDELAGVDAVDGGAPGPVDPHPPG